MATPVMYLKALIWANLRARFYLWPLPAIKAMSCPRLMKFVAWATGVTPPHFRMAAAFQIVTGQRAAFFGSDWGHESFSTLKANVWYGPYLKQPKWCRDWFAVEDKKWLR